jgi:pyruvate-ferredoxin/flavodoxin oxidoreductase
MTGTPVKILVLDTQVYSNTGGQACTSSFISQVADMSPYGAAWKGKREIRKEMSLIGMAHRSAYVLQGSIANITHLIEGYIDGLNSRRPALFNIYAVCQPEHGVADNASAKQAKLAVEGRAYPLLKYNPDAGDTLEECLDLSGNPAPDQDWPVYPLKYKDEKGVEKVMELPMTFADFAMTEGRFRKHFRKAPAETWNDNMLPLHEFLDLPKDEREGKLPYLWGVDAKNRLMRVLIAEELTRSVEERRQFWRQLRSIAGQLNKVDVDAIIAQTKADMAQKLTQSLFALAAGGDLTALPTATSAPGGNGKLATATEANTGATWEAVWVDSPSCTTCDECIQLAPKVFQYNGNKQSTVVDPKGASFKDIVKAAEKCTASCIHPGTPWNPAEKDLDKLIKRAAKYQ